MTVSFMYWGYYSKFQFVGECTSLKGWVIMMHKNLDKGLLTSFINLIGKADVLLSDNNTSSHSISPSLMGVMHGTKKRQKTDDLYHICIYDFPINMIFIIYILRHI